MAKTPEPSPEVIERVRLDYCSGVLSFREIAYRHGVSHGVIGKWATKYGWVRNLQARIQARAQQIVDSKAVDAGVDKQQRASTEREAVEANAQLISDIKLRHRSDIRFARDEVIALLEELRRLRIDIPGIDSIAKRLAGSEEMPEGLLQLRAALERNSGLDKRISMARTLVDAIGKLVALERVAYGIASSEDDKGGDGSYEDLLRSTLDEHGR